MSSRTRYEIRDASGALVAIHERIDDPDGKRLLWRQPDGTLGLGDLALADVPLYGIDRLGKAPTVVVCEGEKAAQALMDVGIPAVGTTTGASSTPNAAVLADLTGRAVVLWPDADKVGIEHMRRVARGLAGVASTSWIDWRDAPEHGDAWDFLHDGHTPDDVLALITNAGGVPDGTEFIRRGMGYTIRFPDDGIELSLDRIKVRSGELHGELSVSVAGLGRIAQANFNASSLQTRNSWAKQIAERAKHARVDWARLLEVFCTRILAAEREGQPFVTIGGLPRRDETPYLLWPLLPKGKGTILFADGGTGKSTLARAAAVMVATGEPVIEGWQVRERTNVLVLDWEADGYDWNDGLVAIAHGAGLQAAPNVHYRACIGSLVDQVEEIARFVADHGVGFVIVDSVGMASPAAREGSDPNDGAIRLFQALRVIGATSLLIDHVSKAGAEKEGGAMKPYGSTYKPFLARSTWELRAADQDDPAVRHLALYHRKVNDGPLLRPQGLRIEHGDDYIRLDREEIDDGDLSAALPAIEQIKRAVSGGALSIKDIAALTGLKETTVRGVANRYRDTALTKTDDGRWGLCYRLAQGGVA